MSEVGIGYVLAQINQVIKDTDVHIFSIGFVRVSENGKTGKKGEIKRVKRCMKYASKGFANRHGGKSRAYNINLREHSTLLLTDIETQETIHVKTWALTEYNGYRIRH